MDLDTLVTPSRLEDKAHYIIEKVSSSSEHALHDLKIELASRFEKLEGKLMNEISHRVSKKEFQENKAFQLSLTREVKQIAK